VDIVDQIVERRVAEAVGRGEFDGLPGAGRPLELEDDALVAPEIRVAYRILKNAGYIPEEVRLLRELRTAEQLLARAVDPQERSSASARLRLLLERLGSSRAGPLQSQSEYFERLAERLAGARG
jgi:hypothetical protein